MTQSYVIDANVLFSAFISGRKVYRLFFSTHTIYLPDFAFIELEKYKARILSKTKLQEQEFKEFVMTLLRHVIAVPNLLLSDRSLKRAYQLCEQIDEKDTVYLATAIEMNVPFVTNDKTLYHGLKKRHFTPIVLLEDVLKHLPPLREMEIGVSTN